MKLTHRSSPVVLISLWAVLFATPAASCLLLAAVPRLQQDKPPAPEAQQGQPPQQGQQQPKKSDNPQPPDKGQPAPAQNDKEKTRVDLGKFVSTATTPVGLIIAGAITISFFEAKRADSSGRVRALIGELRGPDIPEDRRKNLVQQVGIYRTRLKLIHRGASMVALTIVFFILTNLGSSLGLIWPSVRVFQLCVIGGMVLGMLTLGGAYLSELMDNYGRQKELETELADFDRLCAEHPATGESIPAHS